jgi:hypothetical protein
VCCLGLRTLVPSWRKRVCTLLPYHPFSPTCSLKPVCSMSLLLCRRSSSLASNITSGLVDRKFWRVIRRQLGRPCWLREGILPWCNTKPAVIFDTAILSYFLGDVLFTICIVCLRFSKLELLFMLYLLALSEWFLKVSASGSR